MWYVALAPHQTFSLRPLLILPLGVYPNRYASYISAFTWAGLYLGPNIMRVIRARKNVETVHKDRLRYVFPSGR